ncbi:MAG: SH3 domain-containing protein [Xanthobacteraceae bacterium]
MTSQLGTALLGASFLGLTAAVALAAPATVERASNLHSGPGINHRVEAVVPAGAPIEVLDCQRGWCAAAYGPEQGFIARSLVEFRGARTSVIRPGIVVGPRYGYYDPHPQRYSYYQRSPRPYYSPSVSYWFDF